MHSKYDCIICSFLSLKQNIYMVYYLKRVVKLPISIKQSYTAENVRTVGDFPPWIPPFFEMAEILKIDKAAARTMAAAFFI